MFFSPNLFSFRLDLSNMSFTKDPGTYAAVATSLSNSEEENSGI